MQVVATFLIVTAVIFTAVLLDKEMVKQAKREAESKRLK